MSGKTRPSLRRKTLENVKWSNLSETDKNCIKAVFEKQIPKKPIQATQPCFYWCSNCESAIKKRIEHSVRIIQNCPFCGQALDWSDTE